MLVPALELLQRIFSAIMMMNKRRFSFLQFHRGEYL